jgi:hypothetical protein
MKSNSIIIFVFLLIILSSCSKEYDLDRSIFIPDKDYPSLPAYSEWGYNTFGALYDRAPFVNTDYKVPAKIICSDEKTSFSLKGHVGESRYYYYESNENPIILNFDLYGFKPDSLSGLMALNDTVLNLTDPRCKVSLTLDTITYDATVLSGTLNFKRVQNLLVDKKQYEIILSGVFDFQALINNEPSTITLGRFDVGIATDNFYKY